MNEKISKKIGINSNFEIKFKFRKNRCRHLSAHKFGIFVFVLFLLRFYAREK
jgi:hypothetical protein